MTIKEACQKWGVSRNAITDRIKDGRIPAAMCKISKGMKPVYIIPDDTEKPTDLVQKKVYPTAFQADFLSDDKRLAYVWSHQTHCIRSIANHLGLPSRMIPRLYDQALARFHKEGTHAPQP